MAESFFNTQRVDRELNTVTSECPYGCLDRLLVLVQQEYYAARLDDYVLSLILIYVIERESQELSDMLSGLHIQ